MRPRIICDPPIVKRRQLSVLHGRRRKCAFGFWEFCSSRPSILRSWSCQEYLHIACLLIPCIHQPSGPVLASTSLILQKKAVRPTTSSRINDSSLHKKENNSWTDGI